MSARPAVVTDRSVKVLSAVDIARALDRLAHQIDEQTAGARDVVLLGVPTRGVALARRLADRLAAFGAGPVETGVLDVSGHRDDGRIGASAATVLPPAGVTARPVVLVDDVLCSGRTVRAALDAIRDLGRPAQVQLAVLVDRGHRELPIRADYVGKNLPTTTSQRVQVRLAEVDGHDVVAVVGTP